MDILQVYWLGAVIISVVTTALFLTFCYEDLKKWRRDSWYDKDVWSVLAINIFVVVVICCFMGAVTYVMYADAHTLPYEWKAEKNAIADIEQYLMRYDNITISPDIGTIGSIGQGMEANELKKELADKRSKLADLETEMLQWINNPMSAYKKEMRQTMEDAGYEI